MHLLSCLKTLPNFSYQESFMKILLIIVGPICCKYLSNILNISIHLRLKSCDSRTIIWLTGNCYVKSGRQRQYSNKASSYFGFIHVYKYIIKIKRTILPQRHGSNFYNLRNMTISCAVTMGNYAEKNFLLKWGKDTMGKITKYKIGMLHYFLPILMNSYII
jgi:hypothetical protein